MTDQNQLGALILSKLNPTDLNKKSSNSDSKSNPNPKSNSKSKPKPSNETTKTTESKSKPASASKPISTSKTIPTPEPIQKPIQKPSKPQIKSKPKSKPKPKPQPKDQGQTDEKLSKLIQELGGDENDISMLKELNDDDDDILFEDHSSSKPDTKLKNELQDLVKGLRFGVQPVSLNQEPIQKNKKTTFEKSNEPIQTNKKTTFDEPNEPIDPIPKNKKIIFGKSNEPIETTSRPEATQTKPEKETKSSTKPKKDNSSNKHEVKKVNPKDQEQDDPESLAAARLAKQEAKASQRRLEAIRMNNQTFATSDANTNKEDQDQSRQKSNNSSWSIEPKPTWYDTSYLPPLPSSTQSKALTPEQIKSLHARGQFVLNTISTQYTESLRPSVGKNGKKSTINHPFKSSISESDKTFIHKILTAGTSSDKLSALILLISSSPLLSISHLNALLLICKKKSRDESGRSIRGLVDWLKHPNHSGLPDRKLKVFSDQKEGLWKVWEMRLKRFGKDSRELDDLFEGVVLGDEWLAVWCFEDWFKKWYLEFLGIIEISSHDVLVFNRIQSVSWIYYLLSSKPEQEQNLLRLLVNKLGDRERSVCSRTGYYLLQILQLHPLMKSIITREVSGLMFKFDDSKHHHQQDATNSKKLKELSKVQDHCRYYGVITLNQITLVKDEDELVAKKLIEVYFELFKEILGRKTEKEEDGEEELNEEEIEEIEVKRKERLKQKKGKRKLEEELEEEVSIQERQAKLLSAILTGLNRSLPYGELDDDRLKNEIENLFKILYSSTLSVSIQSLTLIYHLIKFHQLSIEDRFYRSLYTVLMDSRLIQSVSQHALFLNLLFKALKDDQCLPRVESFIRRIVQVLSFHQAPFICSTLVLLDDLMTTSHPSCRRLIQLSSTSKSKSVEESQDEELKNEDLTETKAQTYDGKKREPKFANASSFPLWEIEPLLSHYHPSVRLNTQELISSDCKVSSKIDLQETHSLNQFLDRFVYKKSMKKIQENSRTTTSKVKGISIMQASLHDQIGKTQKDHRSLVSKALGKIEDDGIGFEEFGKLDVQDVNVDQIFLHKYFSKRYEEGNEGNEKKKPRSKRIDREGNEGDGDFGGKGGSDDGSIEEDEDEMDEDEVWKAMKKSIGGDELDGISDDVDDDEDDLEGFEALMNDDDDDDEGFEGLEDDGSDGVGDEEFQGFDDEEDEGDEDLIIEDMDDLIEFDESDSNSNSEGISTKLKSKRNREADDDNDDESNLKKKVKNEKKKKWGHGGSKGGGVFASAEEFKEMLENEQEEEL